MRPVKGYREAQASGDFERLPAGGYVIKITDIKDEPSKEYLVITYDIAEGPYKDFYKGTDEKYVRSHQFIRSYKDSAVGMFKAFISAIDKSNGTAFGDSIEERGLNERLLVGRILGVLIGEFENENNRGEIRTLLEVRLCADAERIRKGTFKVPELRKLEKKQEAPAGFTPMRDDEVPFD